MLLRSPSFPSISLGLCGRCPLVQAQVLQSHCSHTGKATAAARVVPSEAAGFATSVAAMDPCMEQLVRSIHASPTKAVVYVTGGASLVSRAVH